VRRILLGISLAEAVLVVVAIVLLKTVSATAGLVVLAVAVAGSAAGMTVVIRRAGRGQRPPARSR
jgi:hypothetical protein